MKTARLVFNRQKNFLAVVQKVLGTVTAHPSMVRRLPYASETGIRVVLHHRDGIPEPVSAALTIPVVRPERRGPLLPRVRLALRAAFPLPAQEVLDLAHQLFRVELSGR